jgi:NTE family protein
MALPASRTSSPARAPRPAPAGRARATRAASRPATAGPAASLDLALQGGGSHGAFTWGVLDRLLQDDSLHITAVSGTSAGALNAAVLASGWAQGGRLGARQALAAFWQAVSGRAGCFGSSNTPLVPGADLARYNLDINPAFAWFNSFFRLFTPQQLNPLGLDPLRDIVRRHVDPQALAASPLAVFVTATSVRTGQPRVFDNRGDGERSADLSLDALLASACLPTLFKPVVIDGEPFWDGGYSGNPSLWPLVYGTEALDMLLVRINPLQRPQTPRTAEEITDRVGEITFNAGLVSELRAIAFVQKLVEEGRVDPGVYKNLRLHMVADDAALAPLHPSSKLNTAPDFLRQLHALGTAAAERWLALHRQDVGVRSSLDIRREFLGQKDTAKA